MSTRASSDATSVRASILVVDDHPIIRRGLAKLIAEEADLDICEGADNVEDAFEQVKYLHPTLVLIDIALRDSNGLDLIAQIRAYDPTIKTLVWSTFDEKIYAERVLHAGAMGYVNKQEPLETVITAIHRVLNDEVYLSPRMANRVLQRLGNGRALDQDPITALSDREIEVFRMIGQGMTTQLFARKLTVKPKTIEAYREKIKAKLALKYAAELNCRAVQWVLQNG